MNSFRKVLMVMLVVAVATGSAIAANVTFQVNMSFAIDQATFDPANDMVVIRGTMNEWAGDDYALADDDEDGIYTGTFPLDDGGYEYKHVISPDGWESIDNNRSFSVAGDDLTLPVVWWSNQEPVETVTIDVLFQLNMHVQVLTDNFDPDVDSVCVRGGAAPLEWGGRSVPLLEQSSMEDVYAKWVTFEDVPISTPVPFKFFKSEGDDWDVDGWEAFSGDRTFLPSDAVDGELVIDIIYFSDITEDDILSQDVDVTFEVNLFPAYLKIADPDSLILDVQSGDTAHSVDAVHIQGFYWGWNWGTIPDDLRFFDDGQAPDRVAGDSVFTKTFTFTEGDPKELIYKYGLNHYDVEAGVNENHVVMLSDETTTMTVVDTFGTNGSLYNPYIEPRMSVREIGSSDVPVKFSLEQNYPNPFNPSTTIGFNLPAAGNVTFMVYNVMGQEVVRNELGHLNAGHFELNLDASSMASGVYFYKVQSVAGTATKRMMLMK